MSKGVKALLAVVGAHSAHPHAAERHIGCGQVQNRIVHAASAKGDLAQYPLSGGLGFSKQIQRQRLFTALHKANRAPQSVIRNDRQKRSKDFLLHDGRPAADMSYHRGRDLQRFPAILPADGDSAVPHEAAETVIVLFIDDTRVLPVVEGMPSEKFPDILFHPSQQFLHPVLLNQYIVRRDTGLPAVEKLAEYNSLSRSPDIRRPVDNAGALAPQLQRRRRHIPCGLLQHYLSNLGSAGKKDIIKSLLQQRLIFAAPSLNHRDIPFGKAVIQNRRQQT